VNGVQTAIRAAIDRLDELAGGSYGETLAGLRDRLAATRLRALITGEAKRGTVSGGCRVSGRAPSPGSKSGNDRARG
jgi:hypothetical protein